MSPAGRCSTASFSKSSVCSGGWLPPQPIRCLQAAAPCRVPLRPMPPAAPSAPPCCSSGPPPGGEPVSPAVGNVDNAWARSIG
eukprot:1787412-Rhodomonas_salina.3